MKIQIPKVVIPVEMEVYAAELKGKFLHVWVNPPKDKLQEYDDLVTALQERELGKAKEQLLAVSDEPISLANRADGEKQSFLSRTFDQVASMLRVRKEKPAEGVDVKLLEWYAEIWSQGPEDSRWTVEELRELEGQDPAFLSWMIAQTWQTRTEHLQRKKKA